MSTSVVASSEIGPRIKRARELLGLTQAEFSERAGATTRSQISWEQGRTFPDARILAAWAALGADVAFIITGTRAGTVDATLLGYCDAALRNAFTAQRGEKAQGRVRSSVLAQVYNDALAALAPKVERAAAARFAAERAIAWLDDPADQKLLARALWYEAESPSPSTHIEASTDSIAAGRDVTIERARPRKRGPKR